MTCTHLHCRYHIPRAYLNPKDNLLVIFEEDKLSPEKVEIMNVDRDTICSFVAETYPANVNSWASANGEFHPVVNAIAGPQASLKCPSGKRVVAVEFASFGNPTGHCGNFTLGNCDAAATKKIVEQV